VYIDFEHVESQRGMINELWEIKEIELMSAPEEWVIVNLYNWKKDNRAKERVSIFLACRNEQNWYYNDSLDIIFKIDWLEIQTNLNSFNCVEDDIC
jgi:hypothetical protein